MRFMLYSWECFVIVCINEPDANNAPDETKDEVTPKRDCGKLRCNEQKKKICPSESWFD
jgi:hypothetical protein